MFLYTYFQYLTKEWVNMKKASKGTEKKCYQLGLNLSPLEENVLFTNS